MRFFLLSFLLLLLLHPHAFDDSAADQSVPMPDTIEILVGYNQTPRLWPDSLKWWHGRWIHGTAVCFRPLASYLHYFQISVGSHYGWKYVTLLTLLIFAVICALAGRLAASITSLNAAGYVATVICSMCYFTLLDYPLQDWLAWWPITDSLLCLIFLLAALNAWQEERIIVTWLFFVAASLTKEYAYIFPLMALAVTAYGTEKKRGDLKPIGLMGLFVVALYCYRARVLSDPHHSPHNGYTNSWQAVLMARNWWVQQLFDGRWDIWYLLDHLMPMLWSTLQITGLLWLLRLVWQARRHNPFLLGLLLFLLSIMPLLGFGIGYQRSVLVWPFAAVIISTSLLQTLATIRCYRRRIQGSCYYLLY